MVTATPELYTDGHTLALAAALPIELRPCLDPPAAVCDRDARGMQQRRPRRKVDLVGDEVTAAVAVLAPEGHARFQRRGVGLHPCVHPDADALVVDAQAHVDPWQLQIGRAHV